MNQVILIKYCTACRGLIAMEVKDYNLGGEREVVFVAVGLWPSCSCASCLTGPLSVSKLLFLVLQHYFNLSAPLSLGHLEGF